jgi:hypothetical protein
LAHKYRLLLAGTVLTALFVMPSFAQSSYVVVVQDGDAVRVRDGISGKDRFRDSDPLKAFDWAMSNSRITVIGKGEYRVARPVPIPRDDISLVIAEDATIRLDLNTYNKGPTPFSPRIPVIYNPGRDRVTVINCGNLIGQARKRGVGIFFDGRADGEFGMTGGAIIHAGMVGWDAVDGGARPSVNIGVAAVDCKDLTIPLFAGDGYRITPIEAEGCRGLDIGTVITAPRGSSNGIELTGLNERTHIGTLIATEPIESGVLVRNSTDTTVDNVQLFGDPLKFVKIVHAHEYTQYSARFTQRPFFRDSEGSAAKAENVIEKRVKQWRQRVSVGDLAASLPKLDLKVTLDAEFEDGSVEPVVDKVYQLQLHDDAKADHVRIESHTDAVRAVDGKTGQVLFENEDPRVVIEWALANKPITIVQPGMYTVPGMITVPRDGVSLIVSEGAEIRQDPDIVPDPMPGGRGDYRPLIYNSGHDGVNIINLGALRAHAGFRSVGIHYDGRSDRTVDRKAFIESGREGTINIDGGIILATGPMYADDVVWVVDAKHVQIPVLLGRVAPSP